MPYDTDERLKSYLDTNQLHREQICCAVLGLDKRFTNIRPQHPRGGPDKGRDALASFENKLNAVVAVGFVNTANDSAQQKTSIRKKFKGDLETAIKNLGRFDVYVFFTNLNLTAGDKDILALEARECGITHCEIYDRERMRLHLDGVDGLAIRYQYLKIPLSEAEQASFFARWGSDIQTVISSGFSKVESFLNRLQFLHETSQALTSIQVLIEFDQKYQKNELNHFRAFCMLLLVEARKNIQTVVFGTTDNASRLKAKNEDEYNQAKTVGTLCGGQWYGRIDEKSELTVMENYELAGTQIWYRDSPLEYISLSYALSDFVRQEAPLKLQDIDCSRFILCVNQSMAPKIAKIHFYANQYKILEIQNTNFIIDDTDFSPSIPMLFSAEEKKDKWIRIRPSGASTFNIRFDEITPLRIFAPEEAKVSHKRTKTS